MKSDLKKAASLMGRVGGKRGKGAAKRRQVDYGELARLSWLKRRRKPASGG